MTIFDSDWFKRDCDYTRRNNDIRLGWEGTLNSDVYSSYLHSPADISIILQNNEMLLNELEDIAKQLKLNVSTHIDPFGEDSYTDGKSIILSKSLVNQIKDKGQALDLMYGLFFHEASHCLFTDFIYSLKNKNDNKIIHHIENVIEDELIETRLGKIKPGFINFISKVKYFYFSKFAQPWSVQPFVNDLDKILCLLLYVIRYPKYLEDVPSAVLSKYDSLFTKIYDIMYKHNCFNDNIEHTTPSSYESAVEIYDLLKEYIDESDDKSGKKDGNTKASKSGKPSDDGKSASSDNDSADNDSSQPSKSFDSQENELGDAASSTLKVIDAISKSCSSISEVTDASEYGKAIHQRQKRTYNADNRKYKGTNHTVLDKVKRSRKVNSNPAEYNKILNEMRKYVNKAKSIVFPNASRDVLEISKFRRNGTLDPRMLANAMCNDLSVYQRHNNKRINDVSRLAVVLMLDESGSMQYRDIHKFASKIAITFYEALTQFPEIEFYVYGHGDYINFYLTKESHDKYTIADRSIQCEQNEELAYSIILDDVRKQTKLPIVCINITDSVYLANTSNLQQIFEEYRKKKVSFNLISLLTSGYGDTASEINDTLYGEGNWVPYTDYDTTQGFEKLITDIATTIKHNYKK